MWPFYFIRYLLHSRKLMRQLFIDTETTGLNFNLGHRIIEFAALEMVDRKLTGEQLHFLF